MRGGRQDPWLGDFAPANRPPARDRARTFPADACIITRDARPGRARAGRRDLFHAKEDLHVTPEALVAARRSGRARRSRRSRSARPGAGARQGGRRRLRRGAAHAAARHHRGLDDQQHGRAHVRPARGPRSQDLQAVAHAGHRMEGRQRHDLGVRAAPGRPVPQRRALQRPERQGHDGLHQGPRQQDALPAALGPGEGGPDRQRLHRALRHREALAGAHRPHRGQRFPAHAAQGAQGAGRPGPGREAHRHRALQLRPVGARREARRRAKPRLLAGPGRAQPRDLPLHPRVQRAAGRAPRGRDRHHEGRAAPDRGAGRQERQGHACAARSPRASTTWPS